MGRTPDLGLNRGPKSGVGLSNRCALASFSRASFLSQRGLRSVACFRLCACALACVHWPLFRAEQRSVLLPRQAAGAARHVRALSWLRTEPSRGRELRGATCLALERGPGYDKLVAEPGPLPGQLVLFSFQTEIEIRN